ncbi:MAG: Zn-dependent hydrolase [Inquilinaceae bacterium]
MPVINIGRLRRSLDGVNTFGFNALTGGFNRVGYSDADMAVRDWFAGQMAAAGLRVSRDAVNNLFGRFGPADRTCIMAGSHLDTVPEGGAFDGSLGVCVAFECVRAMMDADVEPKTAIVVVSTAEEEGRFGGMLGSQTIAGAVTRDWIARASDSDGVALTEAMRAQGLDPFAAPGAAWRPGAIRAFLELHIEQGPVLERSGIPIGVVHGVSGVCNLHIRFKGVANHSGTTPMDMRADAFAGLAAFAADIPALIAEVGTAQSRITVGKVDLEPNVAHTIPGAAEFSIVIRDPSDDVMRRLRAAAEARIAIAAEVHELTVSCEEKSWLPPVALDAGLHALLRGEAERLGIACLDMPSGAGHDAQTMQSVCPSGLIFVPSRDGISHAPQEWSDWADIEKGANVMLAALMRLACG